MDPTVSITSMLAVPTTDRVLMGPGPCNPYPEAVSALGRPMLGHLDPEYLRVMDDMRELLRQVFRTKNELTVAMPGPFTASMSNEDAAAIAKGLDRGDSLAAIDAATDLRTVTGAHLFGYSVLPLDDPNRPRKTLPHCVAVAGGGRYHDLAAIDDAGLALDDIDVARPVGEVADDDIQVSVVVIVEEDDAARFTEFGILFVEGGNGCAEVVEQ